MRNRRLNTSNQSAGYLNKSMVNQDEAPLLEKDQKPEGAGRDRSRRSRRSASRKRLRSKSPGAAHASCQTEIGTYADFRRKGESARSSSRRMPSKSPTNIKIKTSSNMGPNIAVKEELFQSTSLIQNLDKLVKLIEKHAQRCPEFAREIEELSMHQTEETPTAAS